tara:strand:- start:25007 stop:25246 length:240 start_codon:yes stop_codon:yes gene_type:complete
MTRVITIISPQGDLRVELNSTATTWGELKAEINADGTFNANDSTAMIRGVREGLTSDSSVLPVTPFSVFLTPSKIKSGK